MPNPYNHLVQKPRELRYKLLFAFLLMSVIPILSCVYLISCYIFPHVENILLHTAIVLFFSVLTAFLGLTMARMLVEPAINAAADRERIMRENSDLLKIAKELSLKDEVTGLYNERYITGRLDEEIRRAVLYQRPCSLLLFDIDGFKSYTARYGQAAADEGLKWVARVLGEHATEVSRVARLRDDEFAVVIPEKNKNEAIALADMIRKKIEGLGAKRADEGLPPMTVSAGVSENPLDGMSAGELLKKADEAMVRAKAGGSNRVAT